MATAAVGPGKWRALSFGRFPWASGEVRFEGSGARCLPPSPPPTLSPCPGTGNDGTDWEPPSEAELKVIQARRERQDKISKLMGEYLLKGYRMLGECCEDCGVRQLGRPWACAESAEGGRRVFCGPAGKPPSTSLFLPGDQASLLNWKIPSRSSHPTPATSLALQPLRKRLSQKERWSAPQAVFFTVSLPQMVSF